VHSDVSPVSATSAVDVLVLSSAAGSSPSVAVRCDAESISATSTAVFNISFAASGDFRSSLLEGPGSEVVETSGTSSGGFSVDASRSADKDEAELLAAAAAAACCSRMIAACLCCWRRDSCSCCPMCRK